MRTLLASSNVRWARTASFGLRALLRFEQQRHVVKRVHEARKALGAQLELPLHLVVLLLELGYLSVEALNLSLRVIARRIGVDALRKRRVLLLLLPGDALLLEDFCQPLDVGARALPARRTCRTCAGKSTRGECER